MKGGVKMGLSDRMLAYRGKHKLTQQAFAKKINESAGVVFRFEKNDKNHHKANIARMTAKMDELERSDELEKI
jgi:transcriptional regulator with XRE-family HTH domain